MRVWYTRMPLVLTLAPLKRMRTAATPAGCAHRAEDAQDKMGLMAVCLHRRLRGLLGWLGVRRASETQHCRCRPLQAAGVLLELEAQRVRFVLALLQRACWLAAWSFGSRCIPRHAGRVARMREGFTAVTASAGFGMYIYVRVRLVCAAGPRCLGGWFLLQHGWISVASHDKPHRTNPAGPQLSSLL